MSEDYITTIPKEILETSKKSEDFLYETLYEERVEKLYKYIKDNVSDENYELIKYDVESKIIMEEITTIEELKKYIKLKIN